MAMDSQRAQITADRSVAADTPTRRTRVREIVPDIPVVMIVIMVMARIMVTIMVMVMIVSLVMVMVIPIAVVGIGGAHIAAPTGAPTGAVGGGRDAFELRPDRCDELQLLLGQIRRMIGWGPRAGDDLAQRLRGDEARPRPAGLIALACQQRLEARQQLGWDGNHI